MRFIILCLILGAGVPAYFFEFLMAHPKVDFGFSTFHSGVGNETNMSDETAHLVGHPGGMVDEAIAGGMVSDTQFVKLGVIVGQMKYDKARITVKAGKPVVVVFHNNDVMLHNILILEPGTLEQVGMAADKMVADPKGQEKGFIPDVDVILHASPLINPGNTYRMAFTAPVKKGEYPYVCTFPGHWRLMQGVMVVE